MSRKAHYATIDDYIAGFSAREREELAAADVALDIALLIYRARKARGLSQRDAAERAGLRQQAVSRLEQPHANVQLDTLRKYLGALGYTIEFGLRDAETGEVVGQVALPLPTA